MSNKATDRGKPNPASGSGGGRAQKKATAERIARLFDDLTPEIIAPSEQTLGGAEKAFGGRPPSAPPVESAREAEELPSAPAKRRTPAPRPERPTEGKKATERGAEGPQAIRPERPSLTGRIRPQPLTATEVEAKKAPEITAQPETLIAPEPQAKATPAAQPPEAPAAMPSTPAPLAEPPAAPLASAPLRLGAAAIVDQLGEQPVETVKPVAAPATPMVWESLKQQKPIVRPADESSPAILAYGRPTQPPTATSGAVTSLLVEVLDDDPDRLWSEDEITLVEQVTDQLSLALENARLFQEARQRAEQLTILNEMSRQLSMQLKLEDVYTTIYAYASRLLDTTNFYIAIYHEDTNLLEFPLVYLNGQRMAEVEVAPLGSGLTDYIVRQRRALLLSDHVVEQMKALGIEFIALGDDLPPQSWLGVPMLYAGKVLGVISAQSVTTAGLYQQQHLELLTAVANQAAVAIQNAVLFEQTQNALKALAISERLQKSIAQAVAALAEKGMTAIAEVLKDLGEAAEVGRAYYFEPITIEDKPYWRLAAEWVAPGVEPVIQKSIFQQFPLEPLQNWVENLRLKGYISAIVSQLDEMERTFLERLGARSLAQFAIPGRSAIPGCIGFEERDYERQWSSDEISALQTVASALASTLAREDLFTQLQLNLSETETLYQASAELNAVQSYDDILQTLRRHSILSQVDYYVSIDLFSHPWVGQNPSEMPERCTTVARWNHLPREAPARNRPDSYFLREFPSLGRLLRPDRLTLLTNLGGDVELDENTRSLYLDSFLANSVLFVPLVVGGLWIGFINAIYGSKPSLQEDETRRLEVLANQAAIAAQNLRQLQQIQARAQYEYLTREIGAQVSSTIDEDTILRTTARAIGQAIGATHVMVALKSRAGRGFLYEKHADRFWLSDTPEAMALLRTLRATPSSLMVPIVLRNEEIGMIEVFDSKKAREWTNNDTTLVQTVSAQVALALDNARLFRETQIALTETETLYQASAELNAVRNQEDILQVLRKYTLLGEADNLLSLTVFDTPWEGETPPKWVIPVARYTTLSMDRIRPRYAVQEYPAYHLLSATEPTIIETVSEDPRLDENTKRLLALAFQGHSVVFFPLVVGGLWIGFITAVYSRRTHFDETEIRRITSLAGQAAVAMQNLRLLEVSMRRASQLQTAAEIARDTSSTLALDTLLQRAVNLLCERFGYYHASIFLIDETGSDAVIRESTGAAGEEMKRRGHKLPVGSRSVIGQVTATGQPVLLNDVSTEEARTIHRFNPLLPHTRAELGMPLKIGDRVIGALDVQASRINAFSEDDVSILQILADQIAVAVDNARVYELAQKAMEEIREADRLKSQFLANMSHELRTPLNSIIGFSRVILKGIDGPINEQQMQDLTAIYNSGQHLLGLINDVLDLSKIEAGKMELSFEDNVNLADIIKGVMSTTIGLVKDKPITLKQEIDPDLPRIRADSIKIRQVLLNLLSNAAKFTEQGSITVRASVQISAEGEPEVLVQVIDTGPGIAPQDQAKLFQPFSQVDGSLTRKTGGSGLGLSISQHLIRMHGGKIGLESELGKGSTFYFTLPVSGPPQTAPASTESALAAEAQRRASQPAPQPAPQAAPSQPPAQAEAGPNASPPPDSPLSEKSTTAASPAVTLNAAAPPAEKQPAAAGTAEAADQPESPSASSGPSAEPPAADRHQHVTILAVDKDPKVIDLYKRYLQKEFSRSDTETAFNMIALTELEQVVTIARGIQPLVITLDVAATSPNGQWDGWRVLQALKEDESTRNIPVIVCTLVAEQERAAALGAEEYLLKPILEEDLIRAVRRVTKR